MMKSLLGGVDRPLLVNVVLVYSGIFALWGLIASLGLVAQGILPLRSIIVVILALLPLCIALIGIWRMQRWGADLMTALCAFSILSLLLSEDILFDLLSQATIAGIMIYHRPHMKPYTLIFKPTT